MQETFDIDFKELYIAIKRKWYITFILVILGAVGLMYFKGTGVTTSYETSTRIIVGNASSEDGVAYNIQDIELYQSYMNTYVAMLKTDEVIEQTVEDLTFNVSGEAIKKNIVAIPQPNTQFFQVNLYWNNRDQAVEILTTLTDTFIREMSIIYPDIHLHVMDKVQAPNTIVSGTPRRYIVIIGGIIGGVLSLLIIFGLEFLDGTVKSEKEIKHRLKSYLLATVPKQKKADITINLDEGRLPSSYFMEAFRRLRTNLSYVSINFKIQTILVTSNGKNEGKSVTSAMLALCLALSGKKTLLIDCDIRNPSLQKYLSIEGEQGLVDVLVEQIMTDKTIKMDIVQNLDFLPAGSSPINPSEILCSEILKKWIEILKSHYDYIIIDTAPIGLVADAQILMQYADGTILVAAHRKTKLKDLERAKEQIEYVGGKLLGVVINKKKEEMRNKDYYAYYNEKKKEGKKAVKEEGQEKQ